jgi:hypothetical protein
VAKDYFDELDSKLNSGRLLAAKKVAEACLQFATKATNRGRVFNAAPMRALIGQTNLAAIIGGDRRSGFTADEVAAIAREIAGSDDRPLAAWVAAHLISIATLQDFTSFIDTQPVYRLKHLQAFPVVANACKNLYGEDVRLSTKSGYERQQYDPHMVSGLSLWLRDRTTRPFEVTVDRPGGDDFNRCLLNNTLRIALIQLNPNLSELCIETLSDEKDTDHHFFGLHPIDEPKQIDAACKGLEEAVAARAGIALLPELAMTEDAEQKVGTKLGPPIIPSGTDQGTLRVVVSGSFHHVDDENKQRNSTLIRFPRASPPLKPRCHSKSGAFFYKSPRLFLQTMDCDATRAADAYAELGKLGAGMFKLRGEDFRENVEPTRKIRLYLGEKFSVVVVICADILTTTIRDIVERLSPSLVLVCNMTNNLDQFVSVAHELIVACQATTVSVNNPAHHLEPVKGALAGMPLRDHACRVKVEDVKPGEILLFDVRGRKFERWSGGKQLP